MSPIKNRDMVFKAGEGAGASGSFFFFTHDKRFIIKTMSKKELDMFLDLLPYYELHLKENKESLISRIYGVYSIRMQKIATVHLMLMANTLNFKEPKRVQRIFDIKGSRVSREVKITAKTKPTATLKDINFLTIQKRQDLFNFMPKDVAKLRRICKADVDFMRRHGIMDYSLLLSAEKIGEDPPVARSVDIKKKKVNFDEVSVRVSMLNDPTIEEEGEFQELRDDMEEMFNPSLNDNAVTR